MPQANRLPSRREALALGASGLIAAALPGSGARAETVPGFSPEGLAAVRRRAEGFEQLHSLVLARDGREALALTRQGPGPSVPVNVKSVSKTLVATLAGIAIGRGVIPGTEAPIAPYLAPFLPRGADPRLERITVGHLLTMRAGLQRTSGSNYGGWVASPNWLADALARPFAADPGARFQYSTGSFHLLGAVLARASGESLHALARAWLGRPLGIEIPPWTRDPQGYFLGGNNMALSPRGMIRFGDCWLSGGQAAGREVVPPSWVADALTPRTRSPFSGDDYGYGWFLTTLDGETAAYARGYGGQMLYLIPRLRITVAITSDPTRPARSHGYAGALKRLVAETVIPAARMAGATAGTDAERAATPTAN